MRVLTSVSRITIGKGGQMTLDNGQTTVADRSRALDGKSFRNVSIRGGGHLTDINLKPCQNETLCKLQVFEENIFFWSNSNGFGFQGQYVTHLCI